MNILRMGKAQVLQQLQPPTNDKHKRCSFSAATTFAGAVLQQDPTSNIHGMS
jgi:hypothetical protein